MRVNLRKPGGVIYADEAYLIYGILYGVQNELGRFAREKQYGDCLAKRFSENLIPFQREVPLSNSGNIVDFIVFGKIVLELKAKRLLVHMDFDQVQRYLQESWLKLGILVNFREPRLHPRRVVRYDEPKLGRNHQTRLGKVEGLSL